MVTDAKAVFPPLRSGYSSHSFIPACHPERDTCASVWNGACWRHAAQRQFTIKRGANQGFPGCGKRRPSMYLSQGRYWKQASVGNYTFTLYTNAYPRVYKPDVPNRNGYMPLPQ